MNSDLSADVCVTGLSRAVQDRHWSVTTRKKPAKAIDELKAEMAKPRPVRSGERRLAIDNLRGYVVADVTAGFPRLSGP